jgi:hypothetical protein
MIAALRGPPVVGLLLVVQVPLTPDESDQRGMTLTFPTGEWGI